MPAPKPKTRPAPDGWRAFALGLVEDAEKALWSDAGADARSYLEGRGLREETIRKARLGVFAVDRYFEGIFAESRAWVPEGICIPWFETGVLVMVNIRRPDGNDPKYRTVRGSRRGRPYPSTAPVAVGRPLVIVEGEFEAMLLNQELAGLVGSVTFGSASDRPKGRGLLPILPASPWYIATDNDPAGDKSAEVWCAMSVRSRRVRPPGAFKDWTEAMAGGVDLRRWWADRLAGVERPELFTWDELSEQRWGPGLADDAPGLVVDVPDQLRRRAALEAIVSGRGDADEGGSAR